MTGLLDIWWIYRVDGEPLHSELVFTDGGDGPDPDWSICADELIGDIEPVLFGAQMFTFNSSWPSTTPPPSGDELVDDQREGWFDQRYQWLPTPCPHKTFEDSECTECGAELEFLFDIIVAKYAFSMELDPWQHDLVQRYVEHEFDMSRDPMRERRLRYLSQCRPTGPAGTASEGSVI